MCQELTDKETPGEEGFLKNEGMSGKGHEGKNESSGAIGVPLEWK